jgi:3-oxoacyl-[acyl-carrier protein] reductase
VGTRDKALVTRYFALNATASFALAEAASNALQDGGRMVLFSSTGARQAAPSAALYTASKAAVEGIARSFAHDLGSRGICVNAIAPGPTDTTMLDPRFRQLGAERSPMKRIGTPRDHAGLVSFLLSKDGGWITGQTLFSNGGYYMV